MSYGGDWSWVLSMLVLCGILVFYFLGKKCGFFPFWSNKCVLNCNLDICLCLVGEKMRENNRFLKF